METTQHHPSTRGESDRSTVTLTTEEYQRLLHRSNLMDGARDILLVADEFGTIHDVNRAAVEVHGMTSADSLLGRNVVEWLHPGDMGSFLRLVDMAGSDHDCTTTIRVRSFRGQPPKPGAEDTRQIIFLDIKASWSAVDRRFYVVETDVTAYVSRAAELEQLSADLAQLARTDALTGLPNRVAFEDELRNVRLSGTGNWLAFVDLDGFKQINDQQGHLAGDALLKEYGRRMAAQVPQAFVARIGGDEFVIVLPAEADEEDHVMHTMDTVRRSLERPFVFEGIPIHGSCSVGTVFCDPDLAARMWLRRADEALYSAKATGRDTVILAR